MRRSTRRNGRGPDAVDPLDREALEDLGQLIDYIAEHNVWAAQTMFEVIENAIIPASITPFLFRTGRGAGTREIVAHPNYIVVHRILEDGIEVVSVVHARQRYPSD